MIKTGDYVLIDASNSVTKIPKLENAAEGPYRVFGHEQYTVVIQLKELNENITADRVALAHRSADLPPISPQSALAIDTQNKNFERTPCFHEILDHFLKNDCQFEFFLNWGLS